MVVGIGIFAISTGFGWHKYAIHLKRTRLLEDIIHFLRFCRTEIQNNKSKLDVLISKYAFNTRELSIAMRGKDIEAVKRLLNREECMAYNDVFRSVCTLTYDDLVVRLKLIEDQFCEFLVKERTNGAENGKLSLKLGVLIGVMGCILVI